MAGSISPGGDIQAETRTEEAALDSSREIVYQAACSLPRAALTR